MWRHKRVWINCSLMRILFFAAVQAEPRGQMVKMEARHETNAIFAASPHSPRKIWDQNEILVWQMKDIAKNEQQSRASRRRRPWYYWPLKLLLPRLPLGTNMSKEWVMLSEKLQFTRTTSWYFNQRVDENVNYWHKYQMLIKISKCQQLKMW